MLLLRATLLVAAASALHVPSTRLRPLQPLPTARAAVGIATVVASPALALAAPAAGGLAATADATAGSFFGASLFPLSLIHISEPTRPY